MTHREVRLTEGQEREFLKEADVKVESLKDTIEFLEDILATKRDTLSYWEKRRKRFSSMVRERAKEKMRNLNEGAL